MSIAELPASPIAGLRRLTNTLRVMVKPLTGGTLEQYLALVPRDRPELPT